MNLVRRMALGAALTALAACSPAPAAERTIAGGLDPDTINQLPASKPDLIEAYGTGSPHQIGELRVPHDKRRGKGPFPVAMLVHGGCWIAGLGAPRNLAPLATWLARHGVASWNVDYRELGSGGGWPTSYVDWAAAAAHLRKLARRYPLDLARLSVIGHSAGASAGLFLAQPPAPGGPVGLEAQWPRPRSIVQLDGLVPQDYLIGADAALCGRPVIERFMGGLPEAQPARYRAVSPQVAPPRVARALFVVAVLPPPPTATTAALRQAGAIVEVVSPAAPNHFDVIAPGTLNFAEIEPALLRAVSGR